MAAVHLQILHDGRLSFSSAVQLLESGLSRIPAHVPTAGTCDAVKRLNLPREVRIRGFREKNTFTFNSQRV